MRCITKLKKNMNSICGIFKLLKLKIRLLIAACILPGFLLFCFGSPSDSVKIEMNTNKGVMVVCLYPETPLHKQNFMKLVNDKFYDGVLFHRVIKDFMAQAGDPNSKNEQFSGSLGQSSEGETIPAEIIPKYHHKKGALSAARKGDQVNPLKASSGSQFYLVQGKKYSLAQLKTMEDRLNSQRQGEAIKRFIQQPENSFYLNQIRRCQQNNLRDSLNLLIEQIKPLATKELKEFKFSEQATIDYSTIGGTPHLDGGYTVFGQVIKGLNVIDSICFSPTLSGDLPKEPIKIISMKLIK